MFVPPVTVWLHSPFAFDHSQFCVGSQYNKASSSYYFEPHPPIIMINMNTLLSQLKLCLLLRLQHVRDHHSSEKVLTGRRQHTIPCQSLLPEEEREPDTNSLCDHQRPGSTCHGMLTHSFRSLCCSYWCNLLFHYSLSTRSTLPEVPQSDQTCPLSLNYIPSHWNYLLRKLCLEVDGEFFHCLPQW